MQPARSTDHVGSLPAPNSPHQCSICFKRYKRREHLHRHRASHAADRPHRCLLCDGRFQRADVLKRHRRTCAGKHNRPSRIAPRRRACDRCVRQKKACNSRHPCLRCSLRAVDCCYSGDFVSDEVPTAWDTESADGPDRNGGTPADEVVSATMMATPSHLTELPFEALLPSSNAPTDPNVLDCASPSWQDILSMLSENPPGPDGLHSLHFLDRFTSSTGLVQSFDCGTEYQRRQVWLKLHRESVTRDSLQTMSNFALLPELPFGMLDSSSMDPNSTGDGDIPLSWLNDPLSLKTHQILLLIKDIVMVKPRNSAVSFDWSPGLQQSCLQFFSPSNLRKFLGLYWAIWHPNVNFVHRPSFDPGLSKPALLATMAVIGRSSSVLKVKCLHEKAPVSRQKKQTTMILDFGSIALKRWCLPTKTLMLTWPIYLRSRLVSVEIGSRPFKPHIWSVCIRIGRVVMPVSVVFAVIALRPWSL